MTAVHLCVVLSNFAMERLLLPRDDDDDDDGATKAETEDHDTDKSTNRIDLTMIDEELDIVDNR